MDCSSFYIISKRTNNGKVNEEREKIINTIMNNDYEDDFSNDIKSSLCNLCFTLWDSYTFERKGGRKFNYDFLMKFTKNSEIIMEIPLEFKFNVDTVKKYPQFLSMSSNNFTEYHYVEYFYDNYVPSLSTLYDIEIPLKDVYMSEIHKCSSKHIFFKTLKEQEKKYKEEKSKLVNLSIEEYLNKIIDEELFNLDSLNSKLMEQIGKVYLLWTKEQKIKFEEFLEEDLYVLSISHIKNNNTLVMLTENCEIHLLLRWKNRKGILYPAWQISIR